MSGVWRWGLLLGGVGLLASLVLLAAVVRPTAALLPSVTGVQAAGRPVAPSPAQHTSAQHALQRGTRTSSTPTVVSLEDTVGFLVKFGLVLLLLYGSLRVLRGFTLRWRGLSPSATQITVLETRYLSPRRTLYLVRAGAKVLLLGGTDQQISLLADVTDALREGQPPDEALAFLQQNEMAFQLSSERRSKRP